MTRHRSGSDPSGAGGASDRVGRLPDRRSLDLLLAIRKTGSLGGAARELNVDQAAATSQLDALEQELGVSLVARRPQRSYLTSEGTLVVRWSTGLFHAANELAAGVFALTAPDTAPLRVAAAPTVAAHLIPRWLLAFHGSPEPSADGMPIGLTADPAMSPCAQVRSGRAHLGFVVEPADLDGVDTRLITVSRMVAVVPPGHPWSGRDDGVAPEEVASTRLVTTIAGDPDREVVDRAVAAATGARRADPLLELSTVAAVRSAVIAGAGPAVLPEFVVRDSLAERRLHQVPLLDLVMKREVRAVWVAGTVPSEAAQMLLAVAARCETAAASIP